MHKSLMSEAESMAYTTMSPRDVKPPPMAMVEPGHGLSQNPVFTAPYNNNTSRPNSWRTWRPSATYAQGLGTIPDNTPLPPPPPNVFSPRYSGFPRGSGVSTAADSSMPEYGTWPPTASNADLTGLTPGPGPQQQHDSLVTGYVAAAGPDRVQSRDYFQQQQQNMGDGLGSYVTYSETPLATPRTPMVVEGEQLAPLVVSQEASPVDNCDYDSGDGRDAGSTRSARSDDSIGASERQFRRSRSSSSSSSREYGGVVDGGGQRRQPEGGGGGGIIQEAQLGRTVREGRGHGGGPQGVEKEPPREQGEHRQAEQDQQDEREGQRQGQRGQQVFEEVTAVQGQPAGLRRSNIVMSGPWWTEFQASPPSLGDTGREEEEKEKSRLSLSSAGFSWSEAASEPYTAPRDGFGLSIIGARHGSGRSRRAAQDNRSSSSS
jgi:hypothetical protein